MCSLYRRLPFVLLLLAVAAPLHAQPTAREDFPAVAAAVASVVGEADLFALAAVDVTPTTGTADRWYYLFEPTEGPFTFAVRNGVAGGSTYVLPLLAIDAARLHDLVRPNPVPPNWLDSGPALQAAEAQGGADFRSRTADTFVSALLFALPSQLDLSAYGLDVLEGRGVWVISYVSVAAETYQVFLVEAETGLTLALPEGTISLEPFDPQMLAPDAELVAVGTIVPALAPSAAGQFNRYVYYSPSRGEAQALYVAPGGLPLALMEEEPPSTQPLPPQWIGAAEALVVARQTLDDPSVTSVGVAELSRGLLADAPERAVWRFRFFDAAGRSYLVYVDAETGRAVSVEPGETAEVPATAALHANYPNPFNPQTAITYTLPEPGVVTLTIVDLLGRPVRTLVQGLQTAGVHEVRWDGTDASGGAVASGVYLYRLTLGEEVRTRAMTLLR